MSTSHKQYTIRNVPARIDQVLRRRAKETRKSFNLVLLEVLAEGAGEQRPVYDDLDFAIGSMTDESAHSVSREVAKQRRIDKKLWR